MRRGFLFLLQLGQRFLALGLAQGVLQRQLAFLDIGLLGAALLFVEAHRGFVHQLLRQGQAITGEDEVGVLAGTGFVTCLQLGQERFERVHVRVDRGADAVPRQGLGQGAFADLLGVDVGGVGNVGNHALMLGALARDAVELGQGQFQFTVVERLDGLHGALAEGLAAEDQAAVVVLHGAGEDLRGGCRKAVHQDGQRTLVEGADLLVGQHVDTAIAVAHQHRGALVDEQAGQLGGLLQGAAAVVAQVDHHAIDLFRFQFGQQLLHVAGGALVVLVAGTQRLEVEVEGRDLDDAELEVLPLVFEVQHRLLRRLFFELHRLAGDGDHLAVLVVGCIARRDHLQAHHRAFRPADQLDHFVQAPADDVDHFVVGLGHADDPVRRRQLLALLGRACRHQAHDLDVLVVALQHRADAFQRQAHVDVEVFRVVRRQVLGVRIVGLGERIDVGLEHVLAAGLVQPCQLVLVALGQQFLDRLRFLAGDLQAQHLVLHALAPEVVELGGVLGPGGFLAIDQQLFVDAEVEAVDALFQQAQRVVEAVLQAFQMPFVDDEARLEVAALEEIIELVAPLAELLEVRRQEIAARRIEHLDVAVEDLRRACIVQWRLVVVVTLEQFDHVQAGDHLFAIGLQVIPVFRRADGFGQREGGLEAEEHGEKGTGQRAFHGMGAT